MIRTDETALICDMAETYGVYDYRRLPVKTAAALAAGLNEDSRIRRKISGQKIESWVMLLAAAVDRLSLLVWTKTKDGQKGVNRPESILTRMMAEPAEEKKEYQTFRTAEEFEAAWAEVIKGEG